MTPGWNEGPWASPWASDPAVTHDARQDGDEPRALARNYTFDISRPSNPMRSLALCDFVSHTSFVLAALRALHADTSHAPRSDRPDGGSGDHDARMSTGGDGSARRATRERPMSNPSGNTLDV